jgi:hypothetical protein
VGLSPLGTATTSSILYQPQMIDEGDCGAIGGMKIGRGNRSTRRKPTPAPLRPPQNPTWQTRSRSPDRSGGKPTTNRLSYGAALTACSFACFHGIAVTLFIFSYSGYSSIWWSFVVQASSSLRGKVATDANIMLVCLVITSLSVRPSLPVVFTYKNEKWDLSKYFVCVIEVNAQILIGR